ncbi:MAG: Trk family potassium uptake protein, partial [Paenibacillaceae bacterium]|nr:Trk family potassium uptake protein [Paenibacillaceae bacterium]
MVITLGAFLLSLAPATAEGHRLGLIDAFFTATSAACVTGLTVVDTGTHFTVFGQVVVLLLLQIGGLLPLILRVMAYSLTIEATGALLLFVRFAQDMPIGQAIYFGIFHSVSIFNNGGF